MVIWTTGRLPLLQELYNALCSGVSIIDAYESMWNKFFVRLQSKVLGSRFIRYGQTLRWIRVYENSTKCYSNSDVSHVHMLVEFPSHRMELYFRTVFRTLFDRLIYPIALNPAFETDGEKKLVIMPGRMQGQGNHPVYVMKQLVSFETASDRFFCSGASTIKLKNINRTVVEHRPSGNDAEKPFCAKDKRNNNNNKKGIDMNNAYKKNIGALFANKRQRGERSPQLTGCIEFDPALVRLLYCLVESHEKAIISLAAWKNKSKNGQYYFTLKASPQYVPEEPAISMIDNDEDEDEHNEHGGINL